MEELRRNYLLKSALSLLRTRTSAAFTSKLSQDWIGVRRGRLSIACRLNMQSCIHHGTEYVPVLHENLCLVPQATTPRNTGPKLLAHRERLGGGWIAPGVSLAYRSVDSIGEVGKRRPGLPTGAYGLHRQPDEPSLLRWVGIPGRLKIVAISDRYPRSVCGICPDPALQGKRWV